MQPFFSVVIPTHNRLPILRRAVQALEWQRGAPDFELIVVDDGSRDDTANWLARHSFSVPAKVITLKHRGPAAARNAGVEAAAGRMVAFVDDDVLPTPRWLKAHRDAHRRRGDAPELAVIGLTVWHYQLHVTRFMRFIGENGQLFGYELIKDPENVNFNFFYTCNLSLDRERLLTHPFDTGFPYAAWEDIETGYRLKKSGTRLVYEAGAVAYHYHPTGVKAFARRQERAGYAAVVFSQRHPELRDFLGLGAAGPPPLPPSVKHWWRKSVARALESLPLDLPSTWEQVLRYHYVKGLRRGWDQLQFRTNG